MSGARQRASCRPERRRRQRFQLAPHGILRLRACGASLRMTNCRALAASLRTTACGAPAVERRVTKFTAVKLDAGAADAIAVSDLRKRVACEAGRAAERPAERLKGRNPLHSGEFRSCGCPARNGIARFRQESTGFRRRSRHPHASRTRCDGLTWADAKASFVRQPKEAGSPA